MPGSDAPEPGLVASLFTDRSVEIYRYVDILTTVGVERGLLGPREAGRLWDRHILNCAAIGQLFAANRSVCDLGSGGGLPGIVLALMRTDLTVTLLEPLLRRTAFLTEVVSDLGLTNVEVVRGRAEGCVGRGRFDYVTARAVAPLERLAGWALPLCRSGGELIAMKGSAAGAELAASAQTIAALGGRNFRIEEYGVGGVEPIATVIRIESNG